MQENDIKPQPRQNTFSHIIKVENNYEEYSINLDSNHPVSTKVTKVRSNNIRFAVD